ncbi:hypothetical protein BJ912DRAFT_997691 [Pholiota molesta]|nr:hypothetical protein BJ912DRAFT_997691 [Pholiota molesta]
MNSIQLVYPKATLFLCWWHVLHAWQQHFVTSSFPELWDLLKKWIRHQVLFIILKHIGLARI